MTNGAERVIHIVDDEAPVRASLAFLLMTAGFAVKAHESGAAFLSTIGDGANACLITDLRMPEMNGVELIEAMTTRRLGIPAIVITGHGDVPMAVAAMKAGALDFIEKPFSEDTILSAIRRACEHADASQAPTAPAILEKLEQLTPREREILAGIVVGLPNKTIAYDLEISPRTVEVHRASIMNKMQARSLPDLVRMTLTIGFSNTV